MNHNIQRAWLSVILVAWLLIVPAVLHSENPSLQPQQSLSPMLRIDWKRGPNLPR